MVQFVTLLLGLIVGSHAIELSVDDRVAAVELVLDGEVVARLDEAPWEASLDFGINLKPRQLIAIAYDDEGVELDRKRQEINRPRPSAEARLFLKRDDDGRPVSVRVDSQSTQDQRPTEVLVTLDGARLLQVGPREYGLPPLEPSDFHVVQADLRFELGGRAHATLTLGGENLADTGDQLTAVAVELDRKTRRADGPSAYEGWFVHEGRSVRVVAAERGPVELVFVRAAGAAAEIPRLDELPFAMNTTGRRWPARGHHMRDRLQLRQRYRARLLEPFTTRTDRGHLSYESFIISPDMRKEGGLYWVLQQGFMLAQNPAEQRVADAVAVAGLQAAMGSHRRAVVLVAGGASGDASVLLPAASMGYLSRLQVPLYVWHLGDGAALPGLARSAENRDLPRAAAGAPCARGRPVAAASRLAGRGPTSRGR